MDWACSNGFPFLKIWLLILDILHAFACIAGYIHRGFTVEISILKPVSLIWSRIYWNRILLPLLFFSENIQRWTSLFPYATISKTPFHLEVGYNHGAIINHGPEINFSSALCGQLLPWQFSVLVYWLFSPRK